MIRPLSAATALALLTLCPHPALAAPIWVQDDFAHQTSAGATAILPVNDFVVAASDTIGRFTVWLSDFSFDGDGVANGLFGSFSGVLSWYVFEDDGGPGSLLGNGPAVDLDVVNTGVDRTDNDEDIFRVSGMRSAVSHCPTSSVSVPPQAGHPR